MGAKGRIVGPNIVCFERLVDGPIDKVWDHLTRPELLRGWLAAEARFEPQLGGAVHFQFDEKGERGTVTCWEPPTRLAYTWNEGGETSNVTFELQPRGESVRLCLTHEKLPAAAIGDFCAGWHAHLDALEKQIATGAEQTRPEHMDAYLRIRPDYVANF